MKWMVVLTLIIGFLGGCTSAEDHIRWEQQQDFKFREFQERLKRDWLDRNNFGYHREDPVKMTRRA